MAISRNDYTAHIRDIVEQCIRMSDAPKWDSDVAFQYIDGVAESIEYVSLEDRKKVIEYYVESADSPVNAKADVVAYAEQLYGYNDDPAYAKYRAAEALSAESMYREVWSAMHTPDENRYADGLEAKASAASAAKFRALRGAWARGDTDGEHRIDRDMPGWYDIAPNKWSIAWAARDGKTTGRE